jgi:hypothetical protein
MIEPWMWIFIIAGGISLGIVLLIIGIWLGRLLAKIFTRHFPNWRYIRQANKHNRKALKLRLARTDFEGIPLPTGRNGEIIITEKMWRSLPGRSMFQLQRIMEDRGKDLGVLISIEQPALSYDTIIRWGKRRIIERG